MSLSLGSYLQYSFTTIKSINHDEVFEFNFKDYFKVLQYLNVLKTNKNQFFLIEKLSNKENNQHLIERNKISKINLITLLRLSDYNKSPICSNPFEYYWKMIFNNLISLTIMNRLFFAHIVMDTIYLFNQNLNLIYHYKLSQLKKMTLMGKYSLLLKFFNDENNPLRIKFFSIHQRKFFVDNIIPNHELDNNSLFRKIKILQLIRENKFLLGQVKINLVNRLRRNNLLYTREVYDLLHNINNEFRVLLFIFSNETFTKRIFDLTFYNITTIHVNTSDFEENYFRMLLSNRKHRDSITVVKRNRVEEMKAMMKKKKIILKREEIDCNKNNFHLEEEVIYCKTDSDLEYEGKNTMNEFRNYDAFFDDEELKSIPRQRHKINYSSEKRSKTNYAKLKSSFSSISTLMEVSLKRPMFAKLLFDVQCPKYFGKEQKVLEINNNGFFKIYKQDKNDNFLSFMIDDIVQIEGETSTNSLSITTRIKDLKKTTLVEFTNAFEKYVFKTIVYNHLIALSKRLMQGNQLKLNVNIMTWNVAGIDVPSDLGIMFNTVTMQDVDIFTIGVQECSIFKIKDWQKHLKTLFSYYGFSDVSQVEMCQMFLIVFVKKELKPFIEMVHCSYKPMGFAQVIGNKGGIVVGFKFMGYQLTFVNCHLAPKPYKVLERNKHAKTLVKSLRICDKFADFDILADYLFWQGDLNYRIDYTFDETLVEILNNNIQLLLAKDQLLRQKAHNQVFYNFQEPEINFFPTYRRIKGKEEYSNKNNQSPSWCDRVMVKTQRELDMLYYDSVKVVKHSDHLPVLAKFSIFLTAPSFDDLDKTLNQKVSGNFVFNNISLIYDFTEAFSELEIEPKFPFKLKLSMHHFINKVPSETKFIEIKDMCSTELITFNQISLNFPPQFIFDLPHSRAQSIFFVLHLVVNKYSYEIGFAKYSLENIEKGNLNILTHNSILDVTWRTRKFGIINFEAIYKF